MKNQPMLSKQTQAALLPAASPARVEFACPFCGRTEVSLVIGKVIFSATIGNLDAPVTVGLAALICVKSHLFFVKENDVAMILESAASAA
jgi:hypothetical protein